VILSNLDNSPSKVEFSVVKVKSSAGFKVSGALPLLSMTSGGKGLPALPVYFEMIERRVLYLGSGI
jgi:hypothetical protein